MKPNDAWVADTSSSALVTLLWYHPMSEDELKLTRRLFLQHSATASVATAWYSVAMKTDALAGAEEKSLITVMSDGILPYSYHEA